MLQRDTVNFLALYATHLPVSNQRATIMLIIVVVVSFYKIPRIKPQYIRRFIKHLISIYKT
jgi:hypothetical protein